MPVSKVIFKSSVEATPEVWMDTTQKTVTAGSMLNGVTALKNDGSDITGTISNKSSSDLTVSGATVTAPAGYYSSSASKSVSSMTLPTSAASSATSGYTSKATISRSTSDQYINIPTGYNSSGAYYKVNAVANGSVTAPSSISGTSATVSTGTNTLTLTKSVSVTPNVTTAGYISSGTAGNASVSLTASVSTRSSSSLTVSGDTVTAPAGYYSSSASKAVASGSEGTPTAIKSSVSNHTVTITPSVTNTAGYISGGTKTGTAVSVSVSELESGIKSITANGTNIDVSGYTAVTVAVPAGVDVPTFSFTSSSPITMVCNKTYNECEDYVDGGGMTAFLRDSLNNVDTPFIIGGYRDSDNALIARLDDVVEGFTYFIYYLPNGSIEFDSEEINTGYYTATITTKASAFEHYKGVIYNGVEYYTQGSTFRFLGGTMLRVMAVRSNTPPVSYVYANGSYRGSNDSTASYRNGVYVRLPFADVEIEFIIDGNNSPNINITSTGNFPPEMTSDFLIRKTNVEPIFPSYARTIGSGFFYNYTDCPATMHLPDDLTNIGTYTFYNCQKLEILDLKSLNSIPANSFGNCYLLQTLILRKSTAIVSLSNVNAFTNTPIRGYSSRTATIYVPSSLISAYQTGTNWSTIYGDGAVTFTAIEGSQYEL